MTSRLRGRVEANVSAMAGEPEERAAYDGGGADTQLRRESFVPLYFQLAEILKERIEAGEWPPGGRFLSERELCTAFAVSRTVVRPALNMLEGDGQLVRIKGRGTFVAPAKVVDRIRGLTRSLAMPIPEGTEIRVIDAVKQKPEQHVAHILGLDRRRDRVAHITTVTSVNERPLFLCDSFISLVRMSGILELLPVGPAIGPTLRPLASLKPDRSQVTIQTSFCSEFEAERLDMSAGGLVFLIRCVELARVPKGNEPKPIELARIVYRADIVELDAELVWNGQPPAT